MRPASQNAPVVELQGVSKTYTGSPVPVLNNLDFSVERSEFISILGPSGCGKTTLLRLIAGFERANAGTVLLDGTVVHQPAKNIFVPPERRKIGFVFQDHVLFPHLNTLQNVMFGLQYLPAQERKERAMQMLDLVGMRVFATRSPHQLSGGQQQRVALARALAPEPKVVLLDEPFSSLDAALRANTRDEVKQILRTTGTTALLVTHDQEEAMGFGDRLLLMRAGNIEQQGTPESVYARPLTAFSALFLGGSNLIRGEGLGSVARSVLGELTLARPATGPVLLSVRPEQIEFSPPGTGVEARVLSRAFKGHDLTFTAQTMGGDEQRLIMQTGPDVDVAVGDVVRVAVRGPSVPLQHS